MVVKKIFTFFIWSGYYVAVVYGSRSRRQSNFGKICDLKMIFKIRFCLISRQWDTLWEFLSTHKPID